MNLKTLLTALLVLTFSLPAFAGESTSAFDRIMKTGTIKCGYYAFPPMVYRNPNTGEFSGLAVDLMNRIGERAGLKIEWTEEVTFGNWVPALQSKRFDVVCAPMWPEIPMARAVSFTDPLFYAGLYPMVRADDTRFNDNTPYDRFNQPDVTFVTQDGNVIDTITREVFPNAKISAVSASVDGPTIVQEVVTGKADAILLDKNGEIEYNKNSPTKLRLIRSGEPIKVQSFTLVVGRDELVLKNFLDNAIRELQNSGEINRMLDKWEKEPDTFLRVAKPYAQPVKSR